MEINADVSLIADMPIDISPRLRSAYEALGIKQNEAARRAGLSPQRLNNYLNRPNQPDIETLARLARAFNVTTDYLLGLSEPTIVEIAPLVARLLELDGMSPERATVFADVVQQALRIASSLPNEGDAALRSRIAAQTVWQTRNDLKPS
jgi:transcriptional regulator with XRE-family HTH domain